MFLSGLDVALIEKLECVTHVQRLPFTFLGCAAGFTAMRLK